MAEQNDVEQVMLALGRDAKAAAPALATSNDDTRNKALRGAAAALRARTAAILEANETDVVAAKARGLSAAMVDRLQLDAKRVEGIAAGLEAIANLADPIGKVDKEWMMPGVRGRNRCIKKKKDEAGKTS
jgi:glutamate-5-semialdehyde dehydrogenase